MKDLHGQLTLKMEAWLGLPTLSLSWALNEMEGRRRERSLRRISEVSHYAAFK